MPFGSLTPLGKQLRSVLATIGSQSRANSPTLFLASRSTAGSKQACRNYVCTSPRLAATAFATHSTLEPTFETWEQEEGADAEEPGSGDTQHHQQMRRRIDRRLRVNHIAEAVKATGQVEVAPPPTFRKKDLSYADVQKEGWRQLHRANEIRAGAIELGSSAAEAGEGTLGKILGSCIRRRAAEATTSAAARTPSVVFVPTEAEWTVMQSHRLTAADVKSWADIVVSPDSLEAAQALATRIAHHGPQSVPLLLLLYILRRPYLSARALRIITQQAHIMLEDRMSRDRIRGVPENAVFLVFTRLARHAREVWPRGLESVSRLLLLFLPDAVSNDEELSVTQLQRLTYMLNKAMRLLALPTAIEPFKNNKFQEAALVTILQFMAGHQPTLQTNREGYRGVILVQLAQRKTATERQWAELKALSWPPWKQQRTAMDSDITVEEHGTSKARETLMRMREAGYAAWEWEKMAQIYTGWDVDHTPTIQTLTLLGTSRVPESSEAVVWAARIKTTRTAQEAWACYLAYEDAKLPPSQEVYLAIFQKLHKESEYRRTSTGAHEEESDEIWRLYAGDRPDIQPLPPSTHLYTYTRTPPPTMHELYTQLHRRKITFDNRCLAYLVENASSLSTGVSYLEDNALGRPYIRDALDSAAVDSLAKINMPLFAAYVELLSRFSTVPLKQASSERAGEYSAPLVPSRILDSDKVTADLAITRAIELLMQRRPVFRPVWNSVLRALARTASLDNVHTALMINLKKADFAHREEHQLRVEAALLMYKLLRRVLALMADCHLDLDIQGFHAFCLAMENMAIACQRVLSSQPGSGLRRYGTEAQNLMRSSNHTRRLRSEFAVLVGDAKLGVDDSKALDSNAPGFLGLLEVPNPAVLHAYVRALGWTADFDGLLEAVRWMAENEEQLGARRELDRNGRAVHRRALIALRVFVERSWISGEDEPAQDTPGRVEHIGSQQRQLGRLLTPASAEVVDEIRRLVESVEHWGGWPDDGEVKQYCSHQRFQQFN